MKYLFILLFIALNTSGCKTEFANSKIETLHEQVMIIHDEVMPEMSTINRIKRKIKKEDQKDSIAFMLIKQLDDAEESMMDWMSGFKLNKKDAPNLQEEYLKKEKVKITEVSDLMKKSINEGKKYLDGK